MRFARVLVLATALMPFTPAGADPLTLKYRDREVDLTPYYFAFPYNIRAASIEAGKIYYSKDEEGGGSHLYVQPLDADGPVAFDADAATPVTTVDLQAINFWGRQYNRVLDALIVEADEAKKENTISGSSPRGWPIRSG